MARYGPLSFPEAHESVGVPGVLFAWAGIRNIRVFVDPTPAVGTSAHSVDLAFEDRVAGDRFEELRASLLDKLGEMRLPS
jgi:hypothetical protein